MCLLAFERDTGGGGSRKRERVEEEGLPEEGEGGWRRMVMAAGGQEVHHKHRRSLSDMNIPTTLLSPRAAPGPPTMDIESVLGVYSRGLGKAGSSVAGGFPSPTKSVNPGLVLNVAGDGKLSVEGSGGVKNGMAGKLGLTSIGNGAAVFANGTGDKKTPSNVQNGRAPLRPLLIVRPSSMATLEVASPRTMTWGVEAGSGDRDGGGSRYRIPLSPLALRREASGLARGVVGVRAGVHLDLGAVARSNCDGSCGELSELQMRRDKLAFFGKQCSRVADHIYVGSDLVARNRETLRAAGVTHVLNCVGFVCAEYFPGDLKYKTLWLQDTPGEDILSILYDVFDFFEEVREMGGRVLVHCCQGVSRSTALAIAYLMWKEGRSYDDTFRDVKVARGVSNPNMGFACQLLQWQKRILGAGSGEGGGGGGGGCGMRLFRIAPHSQFDPLHLVPKIVQKPGAESLDTRGAFVLLARTGLFVWRGKECSCVIARAAEKAAKQVMKYEKVAGTIRIVREGEETAEFWAVLGVAFSTSSSNGGVGHDGSGIRLSAYDADYEAVAKARSCLGSGRTGGAGARQRGWNDLAMYIVQEESCKLGHGFSPSKVTGGRTENGIGKRGGGASSESADGGGGMTLEEDPALATRYLVESGKMERGQVGGSCCTSPAASSGVGLGRGKRAEKREQEREDGAKAMRRGFVDGGPESPTSKRRVEECDTTMAAREGGNRDAQEKGTVRESSDQACLAGSTVTEAVSLRRQVPVEERLGKVGRSNGEVATEARGEGHREREEMGARCSNNGSLPRLFEWPSREEVAVFQRDDLQPQKVFVLWICKARGGGNEERSELMVWVGGECRSDSGAEKGNESDKENEDQRGKQTWERSWWRVGDEFRSWRGLPKEMRIQVVEEGKEPDDFWASFIHG